MKVMQVIYGLGTGGAETLVKDYALKIDKELFNVVVLCIDRCPNSPYEKLLRENGIKVIYIEDYLKFKSNNFILKVINKIQKYLLIKKIIRKENPDVLHTHLLINSYIKFARVNKKCKIFHTVHNEPKVLWDSSTKGIRDFRCAKWLIKHNNMKFISLHEDMRNEINNMFGVDNTIIINNGIDFNRFNSNNIKNIEVMKEELKILKNSIVIGHIGRFNKQKNHVFLVDIFNQLYKKNDNYFLLLIGSGDEMNSVKRKLDNLGLNNNYLILSNRSDIPDLLNIMDCFVFPSLFEGLPVTLIEAQKMNLPCFISDKVNSSVIISNLVIKVNLSKSAEDWANVIFNYKKPSKVFINDIEWDMNEVVKKLEKIYCDEN